jgi:hypothetical protein
MFARALFLGIFASGIAIWVVSLNHYSKNRSFRFQCCIPITLILSHTALVIWSLLSPGESFKDPNISFQAAFQFGAFVILDWPSLLLDESLDGAFDAFGSNAFLICGTIQWTLIAVALQILVFRRAWLRETSG